MSKVNVGGSLAAAQGFFGTTAKKKAAKKYRLKNGSADMNIVHLLKAVRGAVGETSENARDGKNHTLAEIAAMIPKSRGEGNLEPQSLKGRISVICKALREDLHISEGKIAAILPSDYHAGQKGRRSTLTPATDEQAATFFDDVEEVEVGDDDENDASDSVEL